MALTIYTPKEEMAKCLIMQLAEFADELTEAIRKEHMGFNAYDKALDHFHELCAKNIDTWQYLTYQIAVCEDALEETPYRMDWETGCPTGAYADIYDEQCELQDECERWADACDALFENAFNTLYDTLYDGK